MPWDTDQHDSNHHQAKCRLAPRRICVPTSICYAQPREKFANATALFYYHDHVINNKICHQSREKQKGEESSSSAGVSNNASSKQSTSPAKSRFGRGAIL